METNLSAFAWIGSICYALCMIPQAWSSYKNKHSDGVTWGLLWLSVGGELSMLTYSLGNQLYPLIGNYIANLFFTIVILYYKFRKSNKETKEDKIRKQHGYVS